MTISNQSGQMTLDFITALLIAFGLAMVLMAMSLTLSVVEITQYAAFSAARTMSGASENEQVQIENGRQKLKELTTSGRFGGLYQIGWFLLGTPEFRAGSGKTFVEEFQKNALSQTRRNTFVGLAIPFTSKVLEFNIPLIGKTGDEGTFSTSINAFILRNPSQDECFKFFESRREALRASQFQSGQQYYQPNDLVRTEDNGC